MKMLKDLTKDELYALADKNEWLKQQIDEAVYEDMGFIQSEQFDLIGAKVFASDYHYDRLILHAPVSYGVIDGAKVAHKLDRDYLSEEEQKLYDELNEKADKLDEVEYQGDEYTELDEACDNLADKLAVLIADDLNAIYCSENYEMYKDDKIDRILDGDDWMSDLELEGDKIKQVVYH